MQEVCHRYGCGEGDWGSVNVLKSPVLTYKDQKASELPAKKPNGKPGSVDTLQCDSGGPETSCVHVCAYPCIRSYYQLRWRCQWWPQSSECCRCRLSSSKRETDYLRNDDKNKDFHDKCPKLTNGAIFIRWDWSLACRDVIRHILTPRWVNVDERHKQVMILPLISYCCILTHCSSTVST